MGYSSENIISLYVLNFIGSTQVIVQVKYCQESDNSYPDNNGLLGWPIWGAISQNISKDVKCFIDR